MLCSKGNPGSAIKKFILGTLAIFGSLPLVFAQFPWKTNLPQTPPVKIYAEFDKFPVTLGSTAILIVRGFLEPGWHIYSTQAQGEDAPPPTTITYPNLVHQKVGFLQETPPDIIEDRALNLRLAVHKEEFALRQQFKISPLTAVGAQDFAGELHFQMCDNKICTPHQTQAFATPITIEK